MLRSLVFLAAVTLLAAPALAAVFPAGERVGDAWEIRLEAKGEAFSTELARKTTTTGVYIERVVAVGKDSIELIYDFPAGETAERRAQEWRLPARVRRDRDGTVTLLNAPELQARANAWLQREGFTKADCGRWLASKTPAGDANYTKVMCDPYSIMKLVRRYDLRFANTNDRGGDVNEPDTLEGAYVIQRSKEPTGVSYYLIAQFDPEIVRRRLAEEDVRNARAEGDAETLVNSALLRHARDRIVGAVSGTYETDAQGQVTRKQRTVVYTVERPDGVVFASTEAETMTRRKIAP